ncbi:unnamed protein product [Anisakis simplex]|uniref:Protein sleepless n=1 Tax=Anisakis simplex TaxID=6269 RepID=A0A0M3K7M8_ANISI|nr:unnamed protein product [Anisakis simplex]
MLAVFLAVSMSSCTVTALQCYSCVSQLPASTPANAQHALKAILYSAYHIPAVSKWCADSSGLNFKTVPDRECSYGDACLKISVRKQGLRFVIRGCESELYREGVLKGGRIYCSNDESPSICRCTESLCNSAESMRQQSYSSLESLIFILSIMLLTECEPQSRPI